MASIYKATDMQTDQPVAIKIPHPEMEGDPVLFERFQREAEIGQKLDHPGVMKVLAYNTRGQVYMVMEWVEGRLLRHIIHEEKKLPPERAIKFTVEILDALDYIHRNGVVHRDLKPENIMVNDRGPHQADRLRDRREDGGAAADVREVVAGDGLAGLYFAGAGEGKAGRWAHRSVCDGCDFL